LRPRLPHNLSLILGKKEQVCDVEEGLMDGGVVHAENKKNAPMEHPKFKP
jgi:hypothetical protein